MNSVERVKELCKENKIPVSKLEKDLGYANGYIGQLRKGIFPADRLAEIAEYFSVTTEYLLNGKEPGTKYYLNDETAAIAQDIFDNKELRALFSVQKDMSPEDLRAIHNMALALKRKEMNFEE